MKQIKSVIANSVRKQMASEIVKNVGSKFPLMSNGYPDEKQA